MQRGTAYHVGLSVYCTKDCTGTPYSNNPVKAARAMDTPDRQPEADFLQTSALGDSHMVAARRCYVVKQLLLLKPR